MLSIIIPAHNAGSYLPQAVQSALDQGDCVSEVIVVDDRTSDGSISQLAALKDSRLRVLESNGSGPTRTRNTGLHHSAAPYIRFLDADDWLQPGTLAKECTILQELEKQHGKVSLIGDYLQFDETSGHTRPIHYLPAASTEWIDLTSHLIRHNAITGSVLHNRENILAVDGFDESLPFIDEYDLHVRMALHGVHFIHEPNCVFTQRIHSAPHRLSNRSFMQYEIGLFDGVLSTHLQLAHKRLGTNLPVPLQKAFAYRAWEIGRCFLREGDTETARYCFNRAENIHPYTRAGRPAYQFASRLIGPVFAEKLSKTVDHKPKTTHKNKP